MLIFLSEYEEDFNKYGTLFFRHRIYRQQYIRETGSLAMERIDVYGQQPRQPQYQQIKKNTFTFIPMANSNVSIYLTITSWTA